MRSMTLSCFAAIGAMVVASSVRSAEPATANVAAIQAKHDRAFIHDLAEYLRQNPKADDRDQAYAALFNKAIEHDWFSDAEELGRLSAHLSETRHILKKGGQVGKRLDFMMQELNREANTLGAKASVKELADASMELKLLIEQMREQVQNLE